MMLVVAATCGHSGEIGHGGRERGHETAASSEVVSLSASSVVTQTLSVYHHMASFGGAGL